MGRKKKSAPSLVHLVASSAGDTVDDEEEQEKFDAADEVEDGELSRAVEEIRKVGGSTVEVTQLKDGKQLYCRNYAVADYSADRLAADYGPGTYRIRFKGPDKVYIKGGGTIDIAAPLTPPAAPVGGSGGAVQDMLAVLKAEREKSNANFMEWAKLLAPLALPKVLELLVGQKGPSLTEMMQLIVSAKEFHKPEAPMTMTEQLKQLAAVLDLAQNIGGKDSASSATGATWVDLIRDAVNKVPDVIGAVRSGVPIAGPILPGQPQAVPAPQLIPLQPAVAEPSAAVPSGVSSAHAASRVPDASLPGTSVGPDGMDLRALPWLKETLSQLLYQASKGGQPALYAEVILDNLPGYMPADQLLSFLERPDWWQTLQGFDARVLNYQGWFERFHAEVLAILKDQTPDDVTDSEVH